MALDRPKSEEELSSILVAAYNHACSRNYEKAFDLLDWLIQDPATEIAGLRQRAAVRTHMGDLEGAISDLKCVLKTIQFEPADYHALGVLLFQKGESVEAIERFADAVKTGVVAGNNYYTNSSLLLSAEAKLKVCDFGGALEDVGGLPDGYKEYFSGTGMRFKEDIAKDAEAAIERKTKSKFQFKE